MLNFAITTAIRAKISKCTWSYVQSARTTLGDLPLDSVIDNTTHDWAESYNCNDVYKSRLFMAIRIQRNRIDSKANSKNPIGQANIVRFQFKDRNKPNRTQQQK